jgi:iron complex outermembrane receptor protein
MKKTILTGLAALTLACIATTATAETATSLDQVIVTATKQETNLQKTPIAITVVNAKAIEDRHVQSILDLADGSVPGLRVATFEARQSALTIGIRGIVPLDANQPAREQGIGVYIDGVYLGRQHGLNAALLDLERMEVLKGPQGTLFGRNTEGGALSMVTKKPTGEFGLQTNAGIGNYGSREAGLHINTPEVFNIKAKLDLVTQYQDATTKNPLAGQTGWNYYDRQGLRFAARWQPVDSVTVDYSFDMGKDSNSPFYSQLLNYNPNGLPVGPFSGSLPSGNIRPLPSIVEVNGTSRMDVADIGVPQQPSIDQTKGNTFNISWKPASVVELRSITSWRSVDATQWDNAGGAHRLPVAVANGIFSRYSLANLWQNQFSQEFQAVGSLPRVDYVAGVYYFKEHASDDAATPSTNTWNATGTDYTINDTTNQQPGRQLLDRVSAADSKSTAAFGQVKYTPPIFGDITHITLGGRYTQDDKNGSLYMVSGVPTAWTFAQKTSRFNPLATIAVDITPNINFYVKYATGYRSGGASSRSLTYRSFGPEDNKSYELGLKSEFFNTVRVNAALFTMDRTGSQIDFSNVGYDPFTKTTRNTLETINAPGTTKIRGAELEGTAQVNQDLKVSASYTYTYTNVPQTLNPFTNKIQPVFIVFTPRNVWNVSADYSKPFEYVTLAAHIDANAADATQTFDQFDTKNDKSFIVNGRLALTDIAVNNGKMSISLWGRNLINSAYVYRRDPSNAATLGYYGNFNTPRTFGIQTAFKF